MNFKAIQHAFKQLNPREQLLLKLASGLALTCFTWLVLIEPAVTTLINANERKRELVKKVNEVNELAALLEKLDQSNTIIFDVPTDNLSQLNQLLAQHSLDSTATTNLVTADEIEIRFTESPVISVLKCVAEFEKMPNTQLTRIELNKSEAGQVTGQVNLRKTSGQIGG